MAQGKRYPAEFQREAIALVKSSDRSQADIAKSLGVSKQTLSMWLKRDAEMQARRDDPTKVADDDLAELKALRKRVAELEVEKEILRKAAAYFARETK